MEFKNAGIMTNGVIYTEKTIPKYDGPFTLLKDVLESDVDEKYYIDGDEEKLAKWEYLKSAKKIERVSNSGHSYIFREAALAFPDSIDRPSRAILTSESSVNRMTHIVRDPQTGRLRLLTPVEVERLNGFDDNWTSSMSDKRRYFCMGNTVVVDLVEKMGKSIKEILKNEDDKICNKKRFPILNDELKDDALKRRLVNIDFIKKLDRSKLKFEMNERQLFINKFGNMEIAIQYPGKESEAKKEEDKKLWDFRPKVVGAIIDKEDLAFADIWKALYRISKKNKRVFKLVAAEFYRIAFLLDYTIYEQYTTEAIDINKGNERYEYLTNNKIYVYKPDYNIINELKSIEQTILGMSWEIFFAYNDLIAFNEDCKYYYKTLKEKEKENKEIKKPRKTPEEKTATEIRIGKGRINTFLTHMEVIINLDKEEYCMESIIDTMGKLIKTKGIALAEEKDVVNYLSEFIYKA